MIAIAIIDEVKNPLNRAENFTSATSPSSSPPSHSSRSSKNNFPKLVPKDPIPPHDLDVAERAVLYAYTLRFGEPPPLNAALPGRWMTAPTAEKLRWAEQGLDPKWLAVVK